MATRIGIDAKDDDDLIFMNFDTLDQGTNDIALGGKIDRAQSVIDSSRKFFEAIDDQKQFELTSLMPPGFFDLMLDLLQPDLNLLDLWIEIAFIDNPFGIAVDEP